MEKPLVWITGANGSIGHALVESSVIHASRFSVRPITRSDLDLTDSRATQGLFERENPTAVIHCAAIADPPACRSSPERARRINVEATSNVAELASRIPLIFFSTDLVFDGLQGNYCEDDSTNPLSIYAQMKVDGEKVVLRNPRHTVIRLSLNASRSPGGNRGLDEQLCNAWRAGKVTRLFVDEFRNPVPAEVTARATWELLTVGATGLFHLGGNERLSRAEIGRLIAEAHPEIDARIELSSIKDYSGEPRSPDTTLNCSKIQKLLSFELPAFSDWIRNRG